MRRVLLVCFLGMLAIACQQAFEHDTRMYFPSDWRTTYQKVSPCAESSTHGGAHVEIWVNDIAKAAYRDRTLEMPPGSVLLKYQHHTQNPDCDRFVKFTVMKKLEPGTNPDGADWTWQQINSDMEIPISTERNSDGNCITCHQGCGADLLCGTYEDL